MVSKTDVVRKLKEIIEVETMESARLAVVIAYHDFLIGEEPDSAILKKERDSAQHNLEKLEERISWMKGHLKSLQKK